MNILKKEPLSDQQFLNDLFYQQQREIYARITALTFDEKPIEQIEGKVTGGSINIDGSSAVRRTCSLDLAVDNSTSINEFYWGLSNKFKLEIGLENFINKNYQNVIWFKQGIFVISQFNITNATNKQTIKIQGKDKMCLLNGEFSGHLPSTDFAREQYTDLDTGKITFKQLPIKTIIFKLLQEFALEPANNIIINDVDENGQELLEYRGTEPLYLFKNLISGDFDQVSVNQNLICYYNLPKEISYEQYYKIPKEYYYLSSIYVKENDKYSFNETFAMNSQEYINNTNEEGYFKGKISDSIFITYNNLLDDSLDEDDFGTFPTDIYIYYNQNNEIIKKIYNLVRVQYGDVPGYRISDLVYPGELKSNAGETITSILDKIKNKFTNFEYYYDIDGRFIFQKKTHYLVSSRNSEYGDNEFFQNAAINYNDIAFSFADNKLVVSCQNAPKLQNLKNDYTVYGNRDNVSFRIRYAIDNKPKSYMPIRKIKDNITILTIDSKGKIKNVVEQYKYYDAPEIQPYNSLGLKGTNTSYKLLDLLVIQEKENYTTKEIEELKLLIDPLWCGLKFYDEWFNLFSANPGNKDQLLWNGSPEDIKKMLLYIVNGETIYDKKSELSIIPSDDGSEKWILIRPQFAAYPYSTEEYLIIDKTGKIQSLYSLDNLDFSYTVIRYKVDWRELIYQMALDYRNLNFEDNYYYYLKQVNPQFVDNKTGYEQYYVDISLWRQLYNPNPELQFDTSMTNLEVQNYNLLIDDDNNNDDLDMVYIKNGYRLAQEEDIENLNYLNTYVISQPNNSIFTSMYPYYTSKECHLSAEGKNYYIEDNTTKKVKKAFKIENNEVIAMYDELAKTAPQKIYISSSGEYIIFAEDEFKSNLKNLLEEKKLYIKDKGYVKLTKEDLPLWNLYFCSDIYSLSFETSNNIYNTDNQIHLVSNFINNPILYLNKILEIIKKYIIYLENVNYNEIKENIFNTLNSTSNNYFTHMKDLSNSNKSYKEERSCLFKILNTLSNNLLEIENMFSQFSGMTINNKLLYLLSILSNLNSRVQIFLNSVSSNYKQVSFISDNATLASYLEPLEKDSEKQYEIIQNINNELEKISSTLNSIKDQYIDSQSKKTLNVINNIRENISSSISEIDKMTDKEKKENEILILYNRTIGNTKVMLEDITTLSTMLKDESKYIMQLFVWTPDPYRYNSLEISKDEYQSLPSNMQEDFKLNGEKNVYEYTKNIKILQDYKIETVKNKNPLYKLLNKIENLKLIFSKKVMQDDRTEREITKDDIKQLIIFEGEILLKDLLNLLSKYDSVNDAINIFKKQSSHFQASIIREDVDNFNYVDNNRLITYEPIAYYKADYNYHRNQVNGNFWTHQINNEPQVLTFWFDFLEPVSLEMSKYAVSTIGNRTVNINDKDVKTIFYKDIPQVIFTTSENNGDDQMSGYTYINLTKSFSNLFTISSKGKTAKERIDELLYQHSYCNENVNISIIPIYNLQPNQLIYIRDDKSNVNGKYIIDKITIPLDYKKPMSVTATKSIDGII